MYAESVCRSAAAALSITEGQRESLTTLAHARAAPHREVQRARALLLAADGVANSVIAAEVGVSVATVRSWRERFVEEGLAKRHYLQGRSNDATGPRPCACKLDS